MADDSDDSQVDDVHSITSQRSGQNYTIIVQN